MPTADAVGTTVIRLPSVCHAVQEAGPPAPVLASQRPVPAAAASARISLIAKIAYRRTHYLSMLRPVTQADLAALSERVRRRVMRWFKWRGPPRCPSGRRHARLGEQRVFSGRFSCGKQHYQRPFGHHHEEGLLPCRRIHGPIKAKGTTAMPPGRR
jgi:hypothetical protein